MKRQWYASPYALCMLLFTIVPLVYVGLYAFTDKSGAFSIANIREIFNPLYLRSLLDSLRLAVYCTIICLLIGYPTAYFLASKDFSSNRILVVLILLPMWMNFLLRTYAMMTLLENNGLVNTLLTALGFEKVQFIGTEGAVLMGMVYNFVSFMVLPIYTALKKLDKGMLEAAEDLGANPIRVVFKVVLPQSLPGVLSGITMVFMPAVTTFAISRLLSSGNLYLAGDMIEELYMTLSNRNMGSAFSLLMLVLTLISTLLLHKLNPDSKGGSA